MLDFSSRANTYASSWRQSIENYWRIKDFIGEEKTHLVYYDDLIENFEIQITKLFYSIGIEINERVFNWYNLPHHDDRGSLKKKLKYVDQAVGSKTTTDSSVLKDEFPYLFNKLSPFIELWEKREL